MPQLDRKLERGNTQNPSTTNILALKWQDKREVRMTTIMHNSKVIGTGKIDRHTDAENRRPNCSGLQ